MSKIWSIMKKVDVKDLVNNERFVSLVSSILPR